MRLRSRLVATAIALATGLPLTLAADDPLESARALLKARKPREALLALASAKGHETDPTFLALRGQTLLLLRRFAEAKTDLKGL